MGMYSFAVGLRTAGVTLADGTFMLVYFKDSNNIGCFNYAAVDLNGPKEPNTLGKDVFYVRLDSDSAYPLAWFDDDGNEVEQRTCSKGNWSIHCLYKIMKDGWEIKDDYPW
jgi:hypothetical protein